MIVTYESFKLSKCRLIIDAGAGLPFSLWHIQRDSNALMDCFPQSFECSNLYRVKVQKRIQLVAMNPSTVLYRSLAKAILLVPVLILGIVCVTNLYANRLVVYVAVTCVPRAALLSTVVLVPPCSDPGVTSGIPMPSWIAFHKALSALICTG